MSEGGQTCFIVYLQAKSVQKGNSALDHCPEQSLSSALKINNVQLQVLQLLLLTHNSSLLECLGDQRPLARNLQPNLLHQEIQR